MSLDQWRFGRRDDLFGENDERGSPIDAFEAPRVSSRYDEAPGLPLDDGAGEI
jgi:hypothetical protein